MWINRSSTMGLVNFQESTRSCEPSGVWPWSRSSITTAKRMPSYFLLFAEKPTTAAPAAGGAGGESSGTPAAAPAVEDTTGFTTIDSVTQTWRRKYRCTFSLYSVQYDIGR